MKLINYTDKAVEKISLKVKEEGFCGASWSDDDLDFVRKEIKDYYIKEQDYVCVYCRQNLKSNNGRVWDVEHIISRESVHEFMFTPENLCVSCPDCNQRKGDSRITSSKARKKLPSESRFYSIIHPHFDRYSDHVDAVKPGEFYISKTKKGENTISICGLNRFYEYAGYNTAVAADDMILQYAGLLSKIDDEKKKMEILREIAALALRQLVVN